MDEFFYELNKPTDILVLGNGFDLRCGLKSSFKHFFDTELRCGNNFNVIRIKSNIWYLIFTYAFMLDGDKGGKIVPFVGNKDPLWMDVENYIDCVFKVNKSLTSEPTIYEFISNTMKSDPELFPFESPIINGDHINQPFQMKRRIWQLQYKYDFKTPEQLLFNELKNFEKDFTAYLKKEIEFKRDKYESEINKFILITMDNHASNSLFILSFNYTKNFDKSIEEEKIINIHGTLKDDNIIIGTGDYESGGLPGRDLFKKSKRRLKANLGSMNLPNKDDIKSVIFYGCSFSLQDWSYFKSIFRKYELGKSNTVFKFLYSNFSKSQQENEKNRDKYYDQCSKIVNSYFEDINEKLKFEDLYNSGEIKFDAI